MQRLWTSGLAPWYRISGRHHLPWRATTDPWRVLVSEVMLQQTQVGRVVDRWDAFLARWPDPAALAGASLADVLRTWQGLGYPRRARALHDASGIVVRNGWPLSDAGLRALPGVGPYTARALRVIAFGAGGPPPRDVNIGRVAARAGLGVEPHDALGDHLDATLVAGKPRALSWRDYTFALFDVGALHCRARPRCASCPLAPSCRSRARLASSRPEGRARRQVAYVGSVRELRGAILAAMLGDNPPRGIAALEERVDHAAAARTPGAVAAALTSLRRDGLVGSFAGAPA